MRDFERPGRSEVYALNGMAATSHPDASRTAINLLQAGGSAVDAAIGAALVLGVAEPHMCGIGGDVLALVRPDREAGVLAVNGSGRAPADLSAERVQADGHAAVPLSGPHAVTLPGAVDAFLTLHARWGRLPRDQVLAPAIRAAENGLPVAPRVACDWALGEVRLQGAARQHFLLGGQAPRAGQVFRAPALAEVLRRIAAEGRAGFYGGEVAADLVASLRAAGGLHREEDFAAVATDIAEPLSGAYRDMTLVEHPPNGQGATALLMARMLAEFDPGGLDPFGAARAHLEVEIAHAAYAARDRAIADGADAGHIAQTFGNAAARRLVRAIDLARAGPRRPPRTSAEQRDTVTLSVIDRDGMAVTLVHSLYWEFGSGLASDRFGILFHNRGAGFSLEPGHANRLAGGKRPMHTLSPAMTSGPDGAFAAFGVMGGDYQPMGHLRILSNLRDFGLSPQAAVDGPRVFAAESGLEIESGYPPSVAATLTAMGHDVRPPAGPIGGAQLVLADPSGVLVGASDPRKDGCALGY